MTVTLDELKALVARATPGELGAQELGGNIWLGRPSAKIDGRVINMGALVASIDLNPTYSGEAKRERRANAALIAAAVNLARALADDGAVERMARALAYAEWPHATIEERKFWADTNWQAFLPKAKAVLSSLLETGE
jgi:hypothetical protein